MAVVQLFSKEGDARGIEKYLSREIEAVRKLATLLSRIRNGSLTEMDVANIQMLAQEALCGAQGAYDTASGYLRKVQSDCEKLTQEKGQLEKVVKDKKQQLSSLEAQLPNIRKQKEEYENRLRRLKKSLRDAKEALKEQRETERLMKIGRNISIGLLFVPIIGTIPGAITGASGAITAVACEIGRANAEENCRSIQRQVQIENQNISKCSRDLESCISRIKETTNEIDQTEKRIKSVEDQLDRLHELLKNRFALDYLLKHGTVAVNELLGKVEVLKFRSEKFCNIDALVIVLNDIIAQILKLPNLLDGKVLQLEASTVEMLESLSGQLKAIDWLHSDIDEFC